MSDEIKYDKFCGTPDEVEFLGVQKIEFDIGSLHKKEGYIWIKPTEKRIGHYRKSRELNNG